MSETGRSAPPCRQEQVHTCSLQQHAFVCIENACSGLCKVERAKFRGPLTSGFCGPCRAASFEREEASRRQGPGGTRDVGSLRASIHGSCCAGEKEACDHRSKVEGNKDEWFGVESQDACDAVSFVERSSLVLGPQEASKRW